MGLLNNGVMAMTDLALPKQFIPMNGVAIQKLLGDARFQRILSMFFGLFFLFMSSKSFAQSAPTDAKKHSKVEIQRVLIEGGRIRVKDSKGEYIADKKLIGALLVGYNDDGVMTAFRIDSIDKEKDSQVDAWIYTFSTQDPGSRKWKNSCQPDFNGRQKGLAIPGYFDESGRYINDDSTYSLTCTSGAIGKCLLFGYLPWNHTKDGVSLQKYYQACTRMVRADYCGNGHGHTRDGMLIELWDNLDIQKDTKTPGLTFEAAWDENGAVCLHKTRVPKVATLADILRECPDKFAAQKDCQEDHSPKAFIFNRSKD
jgi:hypothetical protein